MSSCNIGRAERLSRRRVGRFMLAATLIIAVALSLLDAPNTVRALITAPLFGGILGLLQARVGFCVAYGIAGVENLDEARVGTTRGVARSERLRARLRALSLVLVAALLSTALSGLYLALF